MVNEMKVKLDERAFMPERAHDDDAGLDLRTPIDVVVPGWGYVFIDTGVHVEAPEGCDVHIRSKSGLNRYHGLTADGTVDRGYTGTIGVTVHNNDKKNYHFKRGDKIAQIVVERIEYPALVVVENEDELYAGKRGDDGYGSSGR